MQLDCYLGMLGSSIKVALIVKELHCRRCFNPLKWKDMSPRERKKALESLIFLVEKKDGRIKAYE